MSGERTARRWWTRQMVFAIDVSLLGGALLGTVFGWLAVIVASLPLARHVGQAVWRDYRSKQ